jgi:hypothetical protein
MKNIKLKNSVSFSENEETIKARNNGETICADCFLYEKLEDSLLTLEANINSGDLSQNETAKLVNLCHKMLVEMTKI